MSQQKIATRIVEQKLRASSATKFALTSIFEKFAIGLQDTGPGSGVMLRTDSPLTPRGQTAPLADSAQQWESANRPAPPSRINSGEPSDWDKGVANSKRVSSGILHTVSGAAAQALAAVDRAENGLWNFFTPKSMNTSPEYAAGLQAAKQQLEADTAAAASDVVNGLNIDNQDYFSPTATERATAKTYEMPNPDGGLARLSRGALDLGERSWNNAQAVGTVRGLGGVLNKIPGLTATATSAQKAYETAVPAAVRYGTTYTTGIPAAGNINPYVFAGSLGGQAVLGNTLRGIAQQESERGNTGLAETLTGVSDMLPANLVPNVASATLGPDAADYATNLFFAPAIGTQLNANTGMYHAGYPALTAARAAIREPSSAVAGAQFQEDPAAAPLAAGQPALSQDQRARFDELMGQLAQFDDASLESPEARAVAEELQTIINPSASEAQSTASSENSAPVLRRPFVDDEPEPPAAATPAQPTINEPDLSDPFGDKEQPAPQLPPGAEYLPPGTAPEDVEATSAAFTNLQTQQTDEVRAAVSDTNSPEAQKKIKEGQNAYLEPGAADYAKNNPPPTNSPGDWAGWLNDMMTHVNTSWNNMSPEAQLAFGLGVPLAVIGLLSGNVGGFLLSAVGLGAAGIAAAGSGMFGDTAQTAAESVTGSKTPEPIKPLSDDEQLSVVRGLSSATNPMEYVGANKNEFMEIADLPDDRLIAIAQQFDPQTRAGLVKILTKFNEDIDSGTATLDKLPEWSRPIAAAAKLPRGVSLEDIPQLKTKVERMLQILNSNQATPANNTGAYIQNDLIPKIARCWKGYEPVPGKKPYSEDSCRPQGSKKKKKMKKKAEDYLSFLSSDKPAILTLIRGYYDKQTGPQSKKVSA